MPVIGFVFLAGAVFLYFLSQENGTASEPETVSDAGGIIEEISQAANNVVSMIGENMREIFSLPNSAAPYLETIAKAENDNGIPAGMLGRLLYQESRFRQDIITGKKTSPVGAQGIAQFMPATAAEMGVDPLNPFDAIPAAAKYLRRLYDRFGNWREAVASYNWGQGNQTRKDRANGIIGDDWPKETQKYVAFVHDGQI